LFYAISYLVYGEWKHHPTVRIKIANHIIKNKQKKHFSIEAVNKQKQCDHKFYSVEKYTQWLCKAQSPGGELEILAASAIYKTDIVLYTVHPLDAQLRHSDLPKVSLQPALFTYDE